MKTDLSGHALDLGSGFGYWSLKISKYYDTVTGVDFCKEMTDKAMEVLQDSQNKKIKFICSKAQNFLETEKKFNFVFISGLLIYLNNRNFPSILNHPVFSFSYILE